MHQHQVYDTDNHFVIDPITKEIINQSEKMKLMLGDHNSERFTFEIPRYIDGHDMTLCDKIEIHYINIDSKTKESNKDVYIVDDMQLSPNGEDVVIFSWLISGNATQLAGTLNFRATFKCISEPSIIDYQMSTEIFKGITVSDGISNSEAVIEQYSDVLEQWKQELNLAGEYAQQIQQNASEIDELQVGLSESRDYVNKIINYEINWNDGGYISKDDGNVHDETGSSYSDYVTVIPGTKLIITNTMTENNEWNAFYDANKTFLSSFSNATGEVIVPSGAVKMRLSKYSSATLTIASNLKSYIDTLKNNGTVISENADFAEVGEWSDGNPNNEDRIGYFVSVDNSEPGKTMVKATSSSDVHGVTMLHPGFSGNASADKYDSEGNLLKQYDYVGFAGFVPVIDNGTCTVNGRCMPSDDGTAIPSPNNMGYQVIERIDDTHVLILVEPQADMMVRIKEDVTANKKSISELNDKKITKFYASNLGNTTLNDSDNGKITDMIIFGKTIQDGTPTPDAPVEIQSVVNPVVKVYGKNLVQKVIYGYINQSNQINIDNKSTSVIAYLEKEKTYKISCSKALDRLKIGKLETPDVFHGIPLTNVYEGNISTKTFIANFTGYACIYIKSVKDRDIINSIQIEEGTVATDYEPYKEQSATLLITLNAIPVSSGGNVTIDGQEYIADYVDVEKKQLVRMVGGGRMYGTTNGWDWKVRGSKTEYYAEYHPYINDFKNIISTIAISNAFDTGAVWDKNNKNKIGVSNGTKAYVFIGASSFNRLDDLKTYLDNNEVYVYSILETPTTIDLTDEEFLAFKALAMYYPTTNIFVTSDQLDGYTTFNYPLSMANGWNLIREQLGDTRDYIYDMELQSMEAYVNSEYAVTLAELEV